MASQERVVCLGYATHSSMLTSKIKSTLNKKGSKRTKKLLKFNFFVVKFLANYYSLILPDRKNVQAQYLKLEYLTLMLKVLCCKSTGEAKFFRKLVAVVCGSVQTSWNKSSYCCSNVKIQQKLCTFPQNIHGDQSMILEKSIYIHI